MTKGSVITALVPTLLAGDGEAVDRLVDEALPRLTQIAMKTTSSQEDAEEIALEVIFDSLSRLTELDFSTGQGVDPLFSYMATSVTRKVIDVYRKRRTERLALDRTLGGSNESAPVASLEANVHPQSQRRPADSAGRSIWGDASGESGTSQSPELVRMREFLDNLPEQDRLLAQLRAHAPEMTFEEIAVDLGIAPAAARQRWSRLRRRAEEFLMAQEEKHARST